MLEDHSKIAPERNIVHILPSIIFENTVLHWLEASNQPTMFEGIDMFVLFFDAVWSCEKKGKSCISSFNGTS